MIPPYQLWDHPADPVTEGPAQWLSPSLPAPKGLSVSGGTSHYNHINFISENEDDHKFPNKKKWLLIHWWIWKHQLSPRQNCIQDKRSPRKDVQCWTPCSWRGGQMIHTQ